MLLGDWLSAYVDGNTFEGLDDPKSNVDTNRTACRQFATSKSQSLRDIVLDRHLFTSESVTEGHPDKVADQISDAIFDAMLADDPKARVACETLGTTGLATVAAEITTVT